MIKLKNLIINEYGGYKPSTYHDNMSDDEKLDIANQYFDIGQNDDEESKNNYCWIWDGNKIIAKKGKSHGMNFSHEVADKTFKGWYDINKNKISVVFPNHELRKLGNIPPTIDNLPNNVYNSLINKFGKQNNKPTIIVFENNNNNLNESFHNNKDWSIYEGMDKITVMFETGENLSYPLTYRNKMGDKKDNWRKSAATTWAKIARELHEEELNEIGNPIPKSWQECFKNALTDDRMKPFIKQNDEFPVF